MTKSWQRAVMAIPVLLGLGAVAHGQDSPDPRPGGAAPSVLPPIDVIGASPLLGSGVDRNTVPAQTNVLNSNDLRREGTPNLLGSLNQQVGGVTLQSASGQAA